MENVIQTLEKVNDQRRANVIKMEIDYELSTLFEAIQADDQAQITKCKERLIHLRKEWILLEE